MVRRYRKPATGEPLTCGLCGKAVIAGLRFGPKGANQAMMTVGVGRIHVDKALCKLLEKMTYEELEGPRRTKVPAAQVGSDSVDEGGRALHPVGDVGVDQAGDGR